MYSASQQLHIAQKKIRILYLIPSLSLGGAEVQLLRLCRRINKDKFQISVGSFYSEGQLSSRFLAIPKIDVVFYGKKSELDFLWLVRLIQHVRINPVDIVEMWNTSAKTIGMIVAKLISVPATVVRERSAGYLYTSTGSVLYSYLDKIFARHASLVIANSVAGKNFSIHKGIKPEKIKIVYNSIEAEQMIPHSTKRQVRYEFKIEDCVPVVGIVARLIPEKDHFNFLDAAKIVSTRWPQVKFLIVGDGPLLQQLRNHTGKIKMQKNVIFTGRRSDVADLLHAMDIFVLSSSITEGCSNAIMEAMFMGKAIVATSVGGNPELIENKKNGLLVPPAHPEKLAHAIGCLLQNPDLRSKLGKNAMEEACRKFSAETTIRQNEILYESLLNFS